MVMVCCIQSVYHTCSPLGDLTTNAASLIPGTFMILSIAVVVTVALLPLEFQVWWLAWCHPTMDGQRRKVHSQSALHNAMSPINQKCTQRLPDKLLPEDVYPLSSIQYMVSGLNRCIYRQWRLGSTMYVCIITSMAQLHLSWQALRPLCCMSFTCDSMSNISDNAMTLV